MAITRNPQVGDPQHTTDHQFINEHVLDYFPCVIVQDGVGGSTRPRPPVEVIEGGRVLWLLFDEPSDPTWPNDIAERDLVGNMRSLDNPWE